MCSAHNVAIYIGIRENSIGIKNILSVLTINSGNFEFVFLPYYIIVGMKKKFWFLKKPRWTHIFGGCVPVACLTLYRVLFWRKISSAVYNNQTFFVFGIFLAFSLSLTFDILDLGGGHKLLGSHCIVVMEH